MSNSGYTPQLNSKTIFENVNPNIINIGFLIFFESTKKIMFQDSSMKLHPLDRVSFLSNEWNFNNGDKNIPKPYIFDGSNAVKEYGDNLLYGYVNGTVDHIIIFGSVMKLAFGTMSENLDTDLTDIESINTKSLERNNKNRSFTFMEDGTGNVIFYLQGKGETGKANISMKVRGTDNNGLFSIEGDGKIALTMVQGEPSNEKVTAQILINGESGNESIMIKDKFKNKIFIDKDGVSFETDEKIKVVAKKDVNIEAEQNAVISAKSVEVTGGELKVNGKTTPSGNGAFCGIPNCVFTGAPHTGNIIQGT